LSCASPELMIHCKCESKEIDLVRTRLPAAFISDGFWQAFY
jgi:hypothetical protein